MPSTDGATEGALRPAPMAYAQSAPGVSASSSATTQNWRTSDISMELLLSLRPFPTAVNVTPKQVKCSALLLRNCRLLWNNYRCGCIKPGDSFTAPRRRADECHRPRQPGGAQPLLVPSKAEGSRAVGSDRTLPRRRFSGSRWAPL